MAAFDTNRPQALQTIAGFRFGRFLTALTNWNDTRVTRNALSKLSARELSDIGLSRCDIDAL